MGKKAYKHHDADPQIQFTDAVSRYGSQSALARALGLERATVSGWKDMEYLPPLQAHRLVKMDPGYFTPKLVLKSISTEKVKSARHE